MRNFNMLAAVVGALLASGAASAKEKPDQPKPKKVCRTEHMPGRITPKRICRVVPPSDIPATGDSRDAGDSRESDKGRD